VPRTCDGARQPGGEDGVAVDMHIMEAKQLKLRPGVLGTVVARTSLWRVTSR
jgi:hypothetical protein